MGIKGLVFNWDRGLVWDDEKVLELALVGWLN